MPILGRLECLRVNCCRDINDCINLIEKNISSTKFEMLYSFDMNNSSHDQEIKVALACLLAYGFVLFLAVQLWG